MHFLYEIIPVFLFFMAFKFYGIYVATKVGIITSFLQVIISRLWLKKWDKAQLITLGVFLVFGGMTLYYHDPIFVKWKPTIVFWVFATVIFGSHFLMQKPILQRMMENALQAKHPIPQQVWTRLSMVWSAFFLILGAVNIYIAYHFSNDAWVNFKFYGVTGALIALSILQTLYLMRYLAETN